LWAKSESHRTTADTAAATGHRRHHTMKFGELLDQFDHESIDYNRLKEQVADSNRFIDDLLSEIRRIDGVYETT
jgi:hypothetical protein